MAALALTLEGLAGLPLRLHLLIALFVAGALVTLDYRRRARSGRIMGVGL